MYNMFIDDERNPVDAKWAEWYGVIWDWVVVRSLAEAEEHINKFGFPAIVTFDHDLGDNVPTGFDICKLMINNDIDGVWQIPADFEFHVHSMNPIGKTNIETMFRNYLNFRKSN